MRAFIIFGTFALLAAGKQHKREPTPRSLRKGSKDELATAPKRRLATGIVEEEHQQLEGFRAATNLLEGGLLAQVAGAITTTGHDLIDTAAKGQKLLRADAKLALGNAVEPLYLGVQDDARKITLGTKAIAGSLGLDTIKSDAKKVITSAADVVRQGEQNIANALRDFTSSIILRQQ